jgi:hypothetical protein
MGMREQFQRRAKLGGIFRGIGLAALLVAVNGVAAFNFIPSSYQQFSWEAHANVVYTDTPTTTATATPTGTPTATPTETPKIPDGGSCATPSQCQSGFCVAGICCNTICNQAMQTCGDGTCTTTAPAPAVSTRTLGLILALLVAIGFFALTPLRFGKHR